MFNGIIEQKSKVINITENLGNLIFEIEKLENWSLEIGESISVDGVCSTVIKFNNRAFSVEYMPETLRITNLGEKKAGCFLNLERSMKLEDRVSGHFVSGHVDCVGKVNEIINDGNSKVIKIEFPKEFQNFTIYKGSITVNGVSLTVSAEKDNFFEVNLIPKTLELTNLNELQKGETVNLEFDQVAKYINKIMENKYGRA